jgi:hypothetical protein
MEIPFRPLGKIMTVVSSVGLEITYAFDDLVFSENSIFIIHFDEEIEDQIRKYFNIDCDENIAKEINKSLLYAASLQKLKLQNSGKFELMPKPESEKIDIKFFEIQ